MDVRLLPMGASALLVEVADTDAALALRARLLHLDGSAGRGASGSWAPGTTSGTAVEQLVVGARTVLVVLRDAARLDEVGRAVLELAADLDPVAESPNGETVEIAVRYDGADLDDVARLTGLSRQEVVRAHTATPWRVGFGGFAPGFAYLVGGDPRLRVPRRTDPRTRVPAGSVALAEEFSGIYPQDSPGGWQLLGSTDAVLWDPDRNPPALLTPGTTVRFVDIEGSGAPRDVTSGATTDRVTASAPSQTAPADRPPGTGRGLEVLATGPLTLVEDLGRPGLADVGVGRSGAADRAAYLLGLRLVGHLLGDDGPREGEGGSPPAPASLEVTLGGLALRAHGDLLVALTGAPCPADVDGRPVAHAAPVLVADGQVLTLGRPATGLRTWLAVRGGVAVPAVLGSRSTDTLSGVGPPAPTVGDVLPVAPAPRTFPMVEAAPHAGPTGRSLEPVVLEVEPGPRADWCDLDDLVAEVRTVSARSNRVGIRLEGKVVRRQPKYVRRELASEGMVVGAVQVPPGGEPVVFLADHPVTGGYPVVAVLTPEAVARAAQLRPGQRVRLRWNRTRR
ncbi:carboxyltransferase domain-containing protein [Terrabacter sp. 2RAF25]|uniref:5-oxoprolinase subunit B/C family protein n=1 Tax=Terrabacter sp. 2RAF25 TaxID=3232998 RepID=UPI003F9CC185